MRTTLFALASLCGITASAAPMDPIDPAKYAAPVKVACIGDSITQGTVNSPGKDYPTQMQGLLGDKWQVKNFGLGGRTVLKKGDLPYWNDQAFKDAQAFNPNVVIIMLGTNDTKPQNLRYKDEFPADYKELVETFKNLPSKPRVYLCRPVPILEKNPYQLPPSALDAFLPIIDQLAASERVGVIDMHTALAGKTTAMKEDGVHPNDDGELILARTAAAALTGKPAGP